MSNSLYIFSVQPTLHPEMSSKDKTAKEGDTVELVCNVSGIPHPNVTWYRKSINGKKPKEREYVSSVGNEEQIPANLDYQSKTFLFANVTLFDFCLFFVFFTQFLFLLLLFFFVLNPIQHYSCHTSCLSLKFSLLDLSQSYFGTEAPLVLLIFLPFLIL